MAKFRDLYKKYKTSILASLGDSFYHDPIVLGMATLFSVLLLTLLLMLIFRVTATVTHLPQTYSIIYGVTYTSSWFGLYVYLVAMVIMGFLNFLIAWAYFDKERLISYLIGCVNILLISLMILYVFNLTALIS